MACLEFPFEGLLLLSFLMEGCGISSSAGRALANCVQSLFAV